MADDRKGRLVILSGPSCVGKSPLAKALAKFYPELHKTLKPLVLYNSRNTRPGELDGVDYHFRSREQIEKLKAKDHFVVLDVRGDLHGPGPSGVVGVAGQRRCILRRECFCRACLADFPCSSWGEPAEHIYVAALSR